MSTGVSVGRSEREAVEMHVYTRSSHCEVDRVRSPHTCVDMHLRYRVYLNIGTLWILGLYIEMQSVNHARDHHSVNAAARCDAPTLH